MLEKLSANFLFQLKPFEPFHQKVAAAQNLFEITLFLILEPKGINWKKKIRKSKHKEAGFLGEKTFLHHSLFLCSSTAKTTLTKTTAAATTTPKQQQQQQQQWPPPQQLLHAKSGSCAFIHI